MAAASRALIESVERDEERVILPDVILAELIFVLTFRNLYGFTRSEVRDRLRYILGSPKPVLDNRIRCLRALDTFAERRALSYAEAYVAAAALEQSPPEVYSFDQGFEGVPGITRLEPAAHSYSLSRPLSFSQPMPRAS